MTIPPSPDQLSPEHLLTLYQISGWINSTLDFDEVLDNVIDAIMEVTNAQRGFLMIHDETGQQLRVLVARGIDGETIESEGYSTTIANEVVRTRSVLLTNNAQYDERFNAGQSIIMRGLRAILAAPMLVQERLIGVVYVDTAMKMGAFSSVDSSLVSAVSGMAAQAIENARLYAVAREKGRMERELQMAHDIQRSLLPAQLPQIPGYQIVAHWEAAREVAGDFYDAFHISGGALSTVIADVSDKGAPAALFMAVARTLIRSYVYAEMSALEVVQRTNDLLLLDAEQNGMFVTLYHSQFYPGGKSIHVNGGHNPPALFRQAAQEVTFMPIGGRALGWFADNPVKALPLQLQPGDVMVFYTDGLTEAENPAGEPYGESGLTRALHEASQLPIEALRDYLLEDVARFCDGQVLFDDLTMLIVRYTG